MRIYIGWDSNQQEASDVCEYSLRRHSKVDLDIVHLKTQDLVDQGLYYRPDGSPSSTEFTYSRFLVPKLQNYTGMAMFVDSDFLFTYDINTLFNRITDRVTTVDMDNTSCWVSHHPDYTPKKDTKFFNKPQLKFPKKNWSSLIIFNCAHPHCKQLTPLTIANRSPQWLHRFEWSDDEYLGRIPMMWNWLVGEYEGGMPVPFGLHFTNGGPFNGVYGQDYEDIWLDYKKQMMSDLRNRT